MDSQDTSTAPAPAPVQGYAGYGWAYARPWAQARQGLTPIIARLKAFDHQLQKLQTEGGRLSDFAYLRDALTGKVLVSGAYRKHEAALVDRAGLRAALADVGAGLHLEVRQIDGQWPAYYFCRTRQDYWADYSLIVEDLYRSPGYPTMDDRFARLMWGGHESYYLRVSMFRAHVLQMLTEEGLDGDRLEEAVDEVLYALGRHVFQAAWHEDQRPGALCAQHLGMPQFKQAVELLYLCLSGELCDLRSAVDGLVLRFFETGYPHPAIHRFLELLPGMDGEALNRIPKDALALYARLSRAFTRFLNTEVVWSRRGIAAPLYKIVFANFARLDVVSADLTHCDVLRAAVEKIEEESRQIIDCAIEAD